MKVRLVWTTTLLVGLMLVVAPSCISAVTFTSMPEPKVPAATQLAYPAERPMQHQRTNGTLNKIDGNTLTLTTGEGPVTVKLSSDSIPVQKISTGVLWDLLKEGIPIVAVGPQDASGNIAATSIFVLPRTQGSSTAMPEATSSVNAGSPRISGRWGTSGTLTKIDGNILTIANAQGPGTVTIGADTTVQKITGDTPSDLLAGETLAVLGSQDPNGNVIASAIFIEP